MKNHFKSFFLLSITFLSLFTSCSLLLDSYSNNESETESYGHIDLIPIQKFQSPASNGWSRFNVNFAVANYFSDARRFRLTDKYFASITSAESRKESVHWNGDLYGEGYLIPSGFVLRDLLEVERYVVNLAGEIPPNMTDIELGVPYFTDTWAIGQEIDGYIFNSYDSNASDYIYMDSDFKDPSSFNFPVLDPKLVYAHLLREELFLDEINLSITVLGVEKQYDENNEYFLFTVQFKNMSKLEDFKKHIQWFGAGSNGIVHRGSLQEENLYCHPRGVGASFYRNPEITLGPDQRGECEFRFGFPENAHNIYIWFGLFQDYKLYNTDTFFIGD